MKKLLALFATLLIVLTLVACNGDTDEPEVTETETEEVIDETEVIETETEEDTDETENQNAPVGENELEDQITTVVEMLLNDWVDVLVTYDDDGELSTVFLSAATDDFSTLVSVAQEDVEIAETLLGSIVTLHNTLRDVYDIEVDVIMMDVAGEGSQVVFLIRADGTMVNASLATE